MRENFRRRGRQKRPLLPGVPRCLAILACACSRPGCPSPLRRRRLYLHFRLNAKIISRTIKMFFRDLCIIFPNRPNAIHFHRSHSTPTLQENRRIGDRKLLTITPLAGPATKGQGLGNVESAPVSGHTGNAYISVWCTSENDPTRTFAW